MNRHERRRAEAEARRREKYPRVVTDESIWFSYLRHLPQVPLDAPEEPGRVYKTVTHHSIDCRTLRTGNYETDCDCGPLAVTKHIEPVRS
jgi:hypothetical protein